MGHSIECPTEVLDTNIRLVFLVKSFEKVISCNKKLGFTRVFFTKSVLELSQYLVGITEA